MSKPTSLATAVLGLGFLALAFFAFHLSDQPNYPVPEPNGYRLPMAEVWAQVEKFRQVQDHDNRIREVKQQMAWEVIAGRLNLAEAIDAFQKLDQRWLSASHQQKVLQGLGMSEYEWCGLNVLAFAQTLLVDHADEAATVIGRLEKELRRLVADRNKQPRMLADPRIKPAR
jgi:hypothetical protein